MIWWVGLRWVSKSQCATSQTHEHLSDGDHDEDADHDEDDGSPVAGCRARAGRAAWARSTSWRWSTRAHSSRRRRRPRGAAERGRRRSSAGGRSRSPGLWLWSRAGRGRAGRPGRAAGPWVVTGSVPLQVRDGLELLPSWNSSLGLRIGHRSPAGAIVERHAHWWKLAKGETVCWRTTPVGHTAQRRDHEGWCRPELWPITERRGGHTMLAGRNGSVTTLHICRPATFEWSRQIKIAAVPNTVL